MCQFGPRKYLSNIFSPFDYILMCGLWNVHDNFIGDRRKNKENKWHEWRIENWKSKPLLFRTNWSYDIRCYLTLCCFTHFLLWSFILQPFSHFFHSHKHLIGNYKKNRFFCYFVAATAVEFETHIYITGMVKKNLKKTTCVTIVKSR